MAAPVVFGPFSLGESPTLTFDFTRHKVLAVPGAALCNITPPGGVKTPQTLTDQGGGVYTLVVDCNVHGLWTGTVYATGIGKTSRKFIFTVDEDENYP